MGPTRRLQNVLSCAGIASRRRSAEIIRAGRVQVDGRVVTEPGARFDPDRVDVRVNGRPLDAQAARRKVYILLNKPAGFVCTARDPQGRPTVLDLVPSAGVRLFPVGRLDMDTEGLLLLTNDGDAAYCLTHPRFEVVKEYVATVAGLPGERELGLLERGVILGGRPTAPAEVSILARSQAGSILIVRVHEGKKHEVREMLRAVGHPVTHLKRTRLGALELGDLPVGRWRPLDGRELRWLCEVKARVRGGRGERV